MNSKNIAPHTLLHLIKIKGKEIILEGDFNVVHGGSSNNQNPSNFLSDLEKALDVEYEIKGLQKSYKLLSTL